MCASCFDFLCVRKQRAKNSSTDSVFGFRFSIFDTSPWSSAWLLPLPLPISSSSSSRAVCAAALCGLWSYLLGCLMASRARAAGCQLLRRDGAPRYSNSRKIIKEAHGKAIWRHLRRRSRCCLVLETLCFVALAAPAPGGAFPRLLLSRRRLIGIFFWCRGFAVVGIVVNRGQACGRWRGGTGSILRQPLRNTSEHIP